MAGKDAVQWNARYREGRYAEVVAPQAFLEENAAWLPHSSLAIDVAMGLGGSAGFLLERGLRVVGVDISWSADAVDLETFYWPPSAFDLICNPDSRLANRSEKIINFPCCWIVPPVALDQCEVNHGFSARVGILTARVGWLADRYDSSNPPE